MRYLLFFLCLFACNAPAEPAGSGLGSYEFDAPGDVLPAGEGDWGDMMADSYADSLEQSRVDSMEKAIGE